MTEPRRSRDIRLEQVTLFLLPFSALHAGFNITAGDLGFFLLLGLGLSRARVGHSLALVLCWLVAALIAASVAFNSLRGVFAGDWADAVQAFLLFALVLPLGWLAFRDLDPVEIAAPIVLAGVVNAVIAGGQIVDPDLRWFTQRSYGLGEFGNRPLGLTGNPNALSMVLAWTVPLAILLASRARGTWSHLWWSLAAVICAAGALVSFSKTALVTVPVGLVLTSLLLPGRRSGPTWLAIAAVIAGAVVARPIWHWFLEVLNYRFGATDSFDQRFGAVLAAWQELPEWGLLGVGAGADVIYGPRQNHVHNQFLGFAVQFGIPAALGLLLFKATLVLEGLGRWSQPPVRAYLIAFCIAEIILLVHPPYWTRAHYLPVITLMAVLAGAPEEIPGDKRSAAIDDGRVTA